MSFSKYLGKGNGQLDLSDKVHLDLVRSARSMRWRAMGGLIHNAISLAASPLGEYVVPRIMGEPCRTEEVGKLVGDIEFSRSLEGSLTGTPLAVEID